MNSKTTRIQRIKKRVRSKIVRQSEYPRLSVHRSNVHIYAQVIDDHKNVTLVAVSDTSFKKEKKTSVEKAKAVGTMLAEKLKQMKIKQVVFDRGAHGYKGRIKALGDAVREAGIII